MSTLKVGTIQDHTNSNTAISIDSSGKVDFPVLGSVTKNVVSFCASGPSSYTNYGASGVMSYNVVTGNGVFDNTGGNYSTTNSEFTCAIAGLYHFEATALLQSEAQSGIILQYRTGASGTTIANFHGYNHGRHLHTHAIINMTVGQTVRVLSESTTPHYIGIYGRFTGYLIG